MIPLLFTLLAQTPAPAPQKCALEGTVVSATTGAPLKKATVTLESLKELTTTTSAEGKFKFENLEPDGYTITAERVGYLEGPGTLVVLPPGESKTDVVVKLTPQAVISGRVLDEDGDPVVGVRVAYIRWVAAGEKKFKVEEDLQDVNGEGGFTITGLTAGNYYLQAVPDRVQNKAHSGDDFTLTFYPNALDLAGAGALTVDAGAEIRNLEIRMRKSPTFRVRGKIAVPAGATGVPNQLQLISQDSTELSLGMGKSANIEKGSFEFVGVAPGSYILRSSPNSQTGNHEDGEFGWGPAHFFFREPIEVSDRDVDDVTAAFKPAVDLAGTFHANGVTLTKIPVVTLLAENFPSMRQLQAQSDNTGGFHVSQLAPDQYEVVISGLPDSVYIKSMRRGTQEVKGSLDLTSASDAPLEITLASNAAEVSGTLRDLKGNPVPFHLVNLWMSDDDPAKSAQTTSDGSFTFKNLAPGDYHLAAWDNVDGEIRPAFRKIYETQASGVTVRESSRETVDVKLIVAQ